jgi:hypothetical protein
VLGLGWVYEGCSVLRGACARGGWVGGGGGGRIPLYTFNFTHQQMHFY